MKLTARTAITLTAFSFAGCSGLIPPSAHDMAQIPTIRFGEEAPAGKEFATYYPAGVSLPVIASVSGTLMAQGDQATLHVTLKRDVYVFRQWVSFDGKTWQRSNNLVGGNIEAEIPGIRDGKNPGKLSAEFNLKGKGSE